MRPDAKALERVKAKSQSQVKQKTIVLPKKPRIDKDKNNYLKWPMDSAQQFFGP